MGSLVARFVWFSLFCLRDFFCFCVVVICFYFSGVFLLWRTGVVFLSIFIFSKEYGVFKCCLGLGRVLF